MFQLQEFNTNSVYNDLQISAFCFNSRLRKEGKMITFKSGSSFIPIHALYSKDYLLYLLYDSGDREPRGLCAVEYFCLMKHVLT